MPQPCSLKHFSACLTLLFVTPTVEAASSAVTLDMQRIGNTYHIHASINTTLSPCAAYLYLTDYEAPALLPGVVESTYVREAPDKVRVTRSVDERVLLFRFRQHSVLEYTEHPQQGVTFTQTQGDSKRFDGQWVIESTPEGSIYRLSSEWEPDDSVPHFISAHFARNSLKEKFQFMAKLAEQRKVELSKQCENLARESGALTQ